MCIHCPDLDYVMAECEESIRKNNLLVLNNQIDWLIDEYECRLDEKIIDQILELLNYAIHIECSNEIGLLILFRAFICYIQWYKKNMHIKDLLLDYNFLSAYKSYFYNFIVNKNIYIIVSYIKNIDTQQENDIIQFLKQQKQNKFKDLKDNKSMSLL